MKGSSHIQEDESRLIISFYHSHSLLILVSQPTHNHAYYMCLFSLIKILVYIPLTKESYVLFRCAAMALELQLYLRSIPISSNLTSGAKHQLHVLPIPIFTPIPQISIYFLISKVELIPHTYRHHMGSYCIFITFIQFSNTQFKIIRL